MEQKAAKGDVLQRIAGVSLILGAIVTGVANALHPMVDDPNNAQLLVNKVAETRGGFWEIDILFLALGIWLLTLGLAGVYRSIPSGAASAWARLGFYTVLVGTALWSVAFGFELGLPLVVEQWEKATGSDKTAILQFVSSFSQIASGVFAMSIIVNWLALLLLGIGIALSGVYHKLFGWVIIVLSAALVAAVGIPVAVAGESKGINILFAILATLSLIWSLALGIRITREQMKLM